MASITFAVDDKLKSEMSELWWVNWSALAREMFVRRTKQLEILNKFDEDFKNSELTDEDCIVLGRQLKQDMLQSKKQGRL